MKRFAALFSKLTLFVLIAALALCIVSCNQEETNTGSVTFILEVVGPDGTSTEHTFTSDASNLADALLAEGIIAGYDSEFGLTITTVDGIEADFNTSSAYWALYKDGEYSMTGVSSTPIAEGDHFELVYEVYKG